MGILTGYANSIVGCMFPNHHLQRYVSLHFFQNTFFHELFYKTVLIINLEYAYLREVLANLVNNLVCVVCDKNTILNFKHLDICIS